MGDALNCAGVSKSCTTYTGSPSSSIVHVVRGCLCITSKSTEGQARRLARPRVALVDESIQAEDAFADELFPDALQVLSCVSSKRFALPAVAVMIKLQPMPQTYSHQTPACMHVFESSHRECTRRHHAIGGTSDA